MNSYSKKSLEEWKRIQELYRNEYKGKLSELEAAGIQVGLSKELICVLSFPVNEEDYERLTAYLTAFNSKYRDKQYTPLVKSLYETCISLDVRKTAFQKGWDKYLGLQEFLEKAKEQKNTQISANNTPIQNNSVIYPQ